MSIYQHYKNKNLYRVIGQGRLESEGEQGQLQVIYAPVDSSTYWIRPRTEFFGHVELEDGSKVDRFTCVEE